MDALWLSLFSLWVDDALKVKCEGEPDCLQAAGVVADPSDSQSGFRSMREELKGLFLWIWLCHLYFLRGGKGLLSPGSQATCAGKGRHRWAGCWAWEELGLVCQVSEWHLGDATCGKGAAAFLRSSSREVRPCYQGHRIASQLWPCLGAGSDSLKYGYCVTLAGRTADKHV